MIKIIITDDHPLAVAGLKNMLSGFPQFEVIDCYLSGQALLDGLLVKQPDVILLDVLLPDKKGQELAAIISKTYPSIRILAITSLDAPSFIKAMMRAGCKGYLLKNAHQDTLIEAIETIHNGGEYIEASLKEQMLQNILKNKKHASTALPVLTRREKQILELIVQELSNQEIADKLFLSLRTVENHRFNLQQKLEVKNSIGLVKVAIQMGLLEG